jgi:hypothetical protein
VDFPHSTIISFGYARKKARLRAEDGLAARKLMAAQTANRRLHRPKAWESLLLLI